ncbi:MAG: hydrogenase nickel incorporation protein HypB [wastewater metagenome]|nr:hydrogenase nickel incorporation protein HypB [Candidatus Loosdrechtia aerotolerans]
MHDILIEKNILSKNKTIAVENRKMLREKGAFSINMVGSPGSGKTAIIEKTIESLKDTVTLAVIEGDIQTSLDTQRISKYSIPVRQITTGKACHLDAHMIYHTLPWLFEQGNTQILIIENVGNMVCPAEYDLGEDMMIVVMSVTEGDEKPLKYPAIFHTSDVLLINKVDLLGYTDFHTERAMKNALKINPDLKIFTISCKTGEGIMDWCNFLMDKKKQSHPDMQHRNCF